MFITMNRRVLFEEYIISYLVLILQVKWDLFLVILCVSVRVRVCLLTESFTPKYSQTNVSICVCVSVRVY